MADMGTGEAGGRVKGESKRKRVRHSPINLSASRKNAVSSRQPSQEEATRESETREAEKSDVTYLSRESEIPSRHSKDQAHLSYATPPGCSSSAAAFATTAVAVSETAETLRFVTNSQGDLLRARPASLSLSRQQTESSSVVLLGKDEIDEEERKRTGPMPLQPSAIPPVPLDLQVPEYCGRGCCQSPRNDMESTILKKRARDEQVSMDPVMAVPRLRSARLLGPEHVEPPCPLVKPPYPIAASPLPSGSGAYLPGVVRLTQANFNAHMKTVSDSASRAVRQAVARAVQHAAQQFVLSASHGLSGSSSPAPGMEWSSLGNVPGMQGSQGSHFLVP